MTTLRGRARGLKLRGAGPRRQKHARSARKASLATGFHKYVRIFQSCLDANIVGVGGYHVILANHADILEGYYCRIGFLQGDDDDDRFGFLEDVEFAAERRIKWSERLSHQTFCASTAGAGVHVLSLEEKKSILANLGGRRKKARLRRFYDKHTSAGGVRSPDIAIYGEMIEAATSDVNEFLHRLDLGTRGGRTAFTTTLDQLHENVARYVSFVIYHLQREGWSSFTFDLKAKNALVYESDQGAAFAVLCDLDAEGDNCFDKTSGLYRDRKFCSLFVRENQSVLSLAAFIILALNSIHGLSHSLGARHSEDEGAAGPHAHQNCPEYLVAKKVHTILEGLSRGKGYAQKIKKLFKIMTESGFWDESMYLITTYLRLPLDSPGAEAAWTLSTSEERGQQPAGEGLNRRRWLLLLLLNVFKCSSCQKPPSWFLEDLVRPLWQELRIASWQLRFNLSLDFLKQKNTVEMNISNESVKTWQDYFFSGY